MGGGGKKVQKLHISSMGQSRVLSFIIFFFTFSFFFMGVEGSIAPPPLLCVNGDHSEFKKKKWFSELRPVWHTHNLFLSHLFKLCVKTDKKMYIMETLQCFTGYASGTNQGYHFQFFPSQKSHFPKLVNKRSYENHYLFCWNRLMELGATCNSLYFCVLLRMKMWF